MRTVPGYLKEEVRVEPDSSFSMVSHPYLWWPNPHLHLFKTITELCLLFKSFRVHTSPLAPIIFLRVILRRKPASDAVGVHKSEGLYFFIEQTTSPLGKEGLNREEPSLELVSWLWGCQRECHRQYRMLVIEATLPWQWWSSCTTNSEEENNKEIGIEG